MGLSAGDRLGPYEIVTPLGAAGMGGLEHSASRGSLGSWSVEA